jgi:RNAse (barnase) inhibitor barstar
MTMFSLSKVLFMNYEKALKYNRSSLIKYKWSPLWFGGKSLDEDLINKIKAFQKENELKEDGFVGPTTYRRILTEVEAQRLNFKPNKSRKRRIETCLIYNGKKIPILWKKVRLYTEKTGLRIEAPTYYSYSKEADRGPIQFVNHWDAALTSESCAKIINRRKLSMHFCIDNDGTVYQLMDMQDAAWQAGNEFSNRIGLGVEISNAFYLKYQDWYVKNGFGKRPLVEKKTIHGNKSVSKHLGFYDVQIEALAALWECVSFATEVPLEICDVQGVCKKCQTGEHAGFINHFNLTENKIDCSGLDMHLVLSKALELRNERLNGS